MITRTRVFVKCSLVHYTFRGVLSKTSIRIIKARNTSKALCFCLLGLLYHMLICMCLYCITFVFCAISE
jgi:hypothetical protein